ncbi:MAG: 5-(carboxyamino)imidazole ribonucleotide synthase [Acidobacteriota bacterium]
MIIGILGGGQLARMMVLAGTPLGLRFVVLDPAPDACAGQVAPQIVAAYDDRDGLQELAERADLITFDFENVPASSAQLLAARLPIFPPPQALDVAQDRLSEKELFGSLGIETAPHVAIDRLEDLERAVVELGFPAVLKTRRLGYDGKGQRVLRRARDAEQAWGELAGVPLILEGFIDFDGEVSMLAARTAGGDVRFYPLTRNRHAGGILRFSEPAPPPPRWTSPGAEDLETQARSASRRVLEALDYVGLLAIEFFVTEGRLIANEMAPRVHNSGHWTQDGAVTCQFENHLRAGLGWPLGDAGLRGPAAMVNLIGENPPAADVLATTGASLHSYGKTARPSRKVGHVNVVADSWEAVGERCAELRTRLDLVD